MELSEFLEVSTLLDYYKNLLSDKQREYLVNHFEEDLSLSEIAKNNNVSRQAVYDNIKRGIKLLKEYEEKLGFYEKDRELYGKLKELRDNFNVEKIDDILDSYFS